MNTFLKFALVAVGGYVAYEWFTGGFNTPAASTTTTTGATPTNPTTPTPGIVSNNLAKIQQLAGGPATSQTFDDWNFDFQSITGVPGPAPDPYVGAVGTSTRTQGLSISQWQAFMSQAGFSGLRGMGSYQPRPRGLTPRNPFVSTPWGVS